MPWNKGNEGKRHRLEEASTEVNLLRDCWQKIRLMLVHIAGLHTMAGNICTEQGQQRAHIDRMVTELAGVRTALAQLGDDLAAFRAEMGEV